jgi:uncharacterized protein YndB with AHSA1/START domain
MAEDWVEREVLIEASRDQVWAVLTEAEHVAQWFGDSAKIDLRPGGKAEFGWAARGIGHAVIERVEPPALLSYRWALSPGTEPAEEQSTHVEFTLTETFAGTLLRVVETGFASLRRGEEDQDKVAREHTEGWSAELADFKEYAERPVG